MTVQLGFLYDAKPTLTLRHVTKPETTHLHAVYKCSPKTHLPAGIIRHGQRSKYSWFYWRYWALSSYVI